MDYLHSLKIVYKIKLPPRSLGRQGKEQQGSELRKINFQLFSTLRTNSHFSHSCLFLHLAPRHRSPRLEVNKKEAQKCFVNNSQEEGVRGRQIPPTDLEGTTGVNPTPPQEVRSNLTFLTFIIMSHETQATGAARWATREKAALPHVHGGRV